MDKPQLIYVFDPLCGWCYGFSPVIERIAEDFSDRLDIQVLAGGMIVGEERPISTMRDYIKSVLPALSTTTGVTFGYGFTRGILEDDGYMLNSVPSSVALAVFRDLITDRPITLAGELQRAHFLYGKSLNDQATFVEIAARHGITAEQFTDKFVDQEFTTRAYEDFQRSRISGVTGFPTLLFSLDRDDIETLSRGYISHDALSAALSSRL